MGLASHSIYSTGGSFNLEFTGASCAPRTWEAESMLPMRANKNESKLLEDQNVDFELWPGKKIICNTRTFSPAVAAEEDSIGSIAFFNGMATAKKSLVCEK
jgi:hypothetical protein